jgi:hypothetical protein
MHHPSRHLVQKEEKKEGGGEEIQAISFICIEVFHPSSC